MLRPMPSGITLDQKAEKDLREAIAGAPAHGLKPELFLKGGESGQALVQAALKYASALANGYSDPTKLHEVYTIPRPKTDVRAGLQQAIQKGNVGEWLNSLAPQTDEYKALSQAFLSYVKQAEPGGPAADLRRQADQAGRPRSADSRNRRRASRRRLPARSSSGAAAAPASYTPALVAAVKQFQADSGTKPDGVLGKETIGALSAGPGYRARQLAVAMERLRWLQRDPPETRIDVNTAASFLDYWRDGQHVDHRKVINGEGDKPTPQLQAPIFRLVAKPTWTVPKGIGEKELANKSQAWLRGQRFRDEGRPVRPAVGAEELARPGQVRHAGRRGDLPPRHARQGGVRAVRPPPQPRLRAGRECGPVRDRAGRAGRRARPVPEGDGEQGREASSSCRNEIPVRLLYQTAFWDGSRIQFRPDVYGWDENIAKALDLAPGPPQKIEQPESSDDIGP